MTFSLNIASTLVTTELKIKLIPEHYFPIYTQSPPTPIHRRDEMHIELALMH